MQTIEQGTFSVRLAPQPASVAAARRMVRELLVDAGAEDLVDSTMLVVSEIVTNALLHAGTEITLSARLDGPSVLVEVGDGSLHLPSRRQYAATSGTGRGLMMLESMVDDWGVTRHETGKTVWFRVSPDGSAQDIARSLEAVGPQDVTLPAQRDDVAVVFENMPLLLHAAWQEHAEALLRDLLLANLDESEFESIQMHAEATDAIAVLEEHVPRANVTIDSTELMQDVVEPLVSAARVEVPVPAASVSHFDTLDRAVQAALDMSLQGLALTPPTQPEVQSFRRWLCREVMLQADGGSPQPWVAPGQDRGDVEVPIGFDVDAVTRSAQGLIAANEASQIIAVSRFASDLLGYEPDELVGERILAIVPERFRQAHIAGFTMFILVGRQPLLGSPVTVPALRKDGAEIDVRLLITEQGLGQGRSVLMAEIDPA